jgi:hypothetical protein
MGVVNFTIRQLYLQGNCLRYALVGSRAGMDAVEYNWKYLVPARNGIMAVQPIASRYTY